MTTMKVYFSDYVNKEAVSFSGHTMEFVPCNACFGGHSVRDTFNGVYWSPDFPCGFQIKPHVWSTLPATAYEAFGCNYPSNKEAAAKWCKYAEQAWHYFYGDN